MIGEDTQTLILRDSGILPSEGTCLARRSGVRIHQHRAKKELDPTLDRLGGISGEEDICTCPWVK